MFINFKKKVNNISLLGLSYITVSVLLFYLYSYLYRYDIYQYKWYLWFFLSDAFILSIFLIRKYKPFKKVSFDKNKLSVVIACYNGEEVIGATIKRALTKAYPKNIFIVSDASNDNTVKIAKSFGVRVFENERNLNKALSISSVAKYIKTPYTLIVDDDTWIDKMLIPTSLLDDGYSAVAFNMVPMSTGTLVNKMQIFEYRKSMMIYKRLASDVAGVDNVSGAIGLYRTEDIVKQAKKHSGQAGGEDQQRTSYVHLDTDKRGIVFYDSIAYTKAPDTIKSLFKQRAFKWSRSVHENFFLYFKVVVSKKTPVLLKLKKGYQIFIFLTDPLRMYLFFVALSEPIFLFQMYLFYLFFNFLSWIKTEKKDTVWIVFIMPIYGIMKSVARFVAYFHWIKVKYEYVFIRKYYKLIPERKIIMEYIVTLSLSLLFITSSLCIIIFVKN